jgi:hypothetical protein
LTHHAINGTLLIVYQLREIHMTTARNTQISLSDTAWYHCVNRCVRRAYLCGEDHHSGASYEHRRGWIRDRILELADVFAIDVAGYAVMSNHYHVILHVDTVRAEGWSEEEVLVRWCRLFRGGLLVQRYLSEERSAMDAAEVLRVMEYAAEWRGRLIDISWYMRTLNEYIAREANREDGVKGRFWEGRFKSQALLDEQALLTALAYVDLNPIRAGIAETPESSDYTSIQERITGVVGSAGLLGEEGARQEDEVAKSAQSEAPVMAELMPFDATGSSDWAIPFDFQDYLELVEWSGRLLHPGKRGRICSQTPAVLERLGLHPESYIRHAGRLLKRYGSAVGRPDSLVAASQRRQCRYLRGLRVAREMVG